MKRSEIITQLSQYKAEVNRMQANRHSNTGIGFTLAAGKTPCIYTVEMDSKRVIDTVVMVKTGPQLLQAMMTIQMTLKHLTA